MVYILNADMSITMTTYKNYSKIASNFHSVAKFEHDWKKMKTSVVISPASARKVNWQEKYENHCKAAYISVCPRYVILSFFSLHLSAKKE